MQTIKLVPTLHPAGFVQAYALTPEDSEVGTPRGIFREVGWAFLRILSEWLTPEQMHMVAGVNHDNGLSDPCCASHDYCDANTAMDEAFQAVFGLNLFDLSDLTRRPDEDPEESSMSDAATDLWNRAWSHGKTLIETFYLLPE